MDIKSKSSSFQFGIALIVLALCYNWYSYFLVFLGVIFLINAVSTREAISDTET